MFIRHRKLCQINLSVLSKSYILWVFVVSKIFFSRIHQTINIDHRCDQALDCEDGSDERNCTCKDFLISKHHHLICDGKADCVDLSDESDCCEFFLFLCLSDFLIEGRECLAKRLETIGIPGCRLLHAIWFLTTMKESIPTIGSNRA